MSEEDIKYFYAAYRAEGKKKDPAEYRNELISHIQSSYDDAYVVISPVKGKLEHIGALFGQYAGPLLLIGSAIWFPWASKRNVIEGFVNAINELRKEHLMVFISSIDDKRFYEYICKHGIMKRIGSLDDLYDGKQAAMFQSKARK